jgi:hypothetical protein
MCSLPRATAELPSVVSVVAAQNNSAKALAAAVGEKVRSAERA